MRYLIRYIVRTVLWLLILGGLIVGGLRLSMANVGLFRADIETWVSEEVISGVSFGDIRFSWNRINPILELEKAAITLPDRSRPIAVDVIAIQFDLWDSLVLGTPVVLEVSGSIEKLIIRKDQNSRWWLNDIDLTTADSGAAAVDIEELLGSIPHYLQLELKRLIIKDEIDQRVHQIDNIFADIQHHDKAIHMQLLANLPEALGGSIKLKSLLAQKKGKIYLQSGQLKLDPIAALFNTPLGNFRRIEVSGEAWVEIYDHHITSVNGKVDISKARYQARLDEPAIPFRLSMQFDSDKQGSNWQIGNSIENLVINQHKLRDIDAQLRLIHQPDGKQLQGWIKSLDISDYLRAGSSYLPDKLAETVQRTNVQGRVEDVWFNLPVGSPSDLTLTARAFELKNQVVNAIPGINEVDAELVYAQAQAMIKITGEQMSADFGEFFRAPLKIDKFQATAHASLNSDGVNLSIPEFKVENQDIKVAGRLWLEFDEDVAPFMYLRASFDDGIGSEKSKYLPVKLLSKKLLAWVDKGIRTVDISNGGALFHGRLDTIKHLNETKSGELIVGFDIANAEVMFDPNWAFAKQANGSVMFHNMGVDIELDSVNFDGIDHAKAKISLPNYARSVIKAKIDTTTDTESALRVWLATPVGDDFREVAGNLREPGGKVDANISLSLPLVDTSQKRSVQVDLEFDDATVKAPLWGVQLSGTRGLMRVTNEGIIGENIKAFYFGEPIEFDIATDPVKQQTLIKSRGLIDTRQLLNQLPGSLIRGFDGKSVWMVDLAIANTRQTDSGPILTINAASDLKGTAVSLPEPFSKTDTTQRLTQGTISLLANDEINFDVSYGNHVEIRGRLEKTDPEVIQLADLDMAFSTPLKPVQVPGIRLYGNVSRLPLDEWIVFHQTESVRQPAGSRNLMPLMQQVDLNVNVLSLFGRNTYDTDFQFDQTGRGFDGHINSSHLKGGFYFPKQDSIQNPVVIDMDYFRIEEIPEVGGVTSWLPDNFFNMRFRSGEFSYDGRTVTDLEIDTSLDGGSLLIDSLSFKHKDVQFGSNGYWLYSPATKQHFSFIQFSIKGDKFGQSMAELGFGDTIHNGSIDFKGEINWPAEIMSPTWDILSGDGEIKIENGILKGVEPGSGRFVGLFSLNALPRRLSLDFSDFLFEGLQFDDIKGDLVLEGQSLYTSNTKLDGPAVEIKVVGSTGLRDRNYDQKIYVVPKIRHVLPVIGTLAAGTAVGWGLLLLQNLFKSSINDAVEIEYGLTGSWDDPVIAVLNKPKVNNFPDESQNFEK